MRLNRRTLISTALLSALGALVILFSQPAGALEGEEQDEPAVVSLDAGATGPLSVSGFGEAFDLTLIYSPFSPGEAVELSIFLANLETNRPVSNAELKLTLTGPETEVSIIPVPVADSPGEYRAEVSVATDADYSFLVEVSTDDDFDLFSVDGFTPPGPREEAQGDASSFSLGDYTVFFVLAGFIIVGLGAYSLGARERGMREKKQKKAKETGELT